MADPPDTGANQDDPPETSEAAGGGAAARTIALLDGRHDPERFAPIMPMATEATWRPEGPGR